VAVGNTRLQNRQFVLRKALQDEARSHLLLTPRYELAAVIHTGKVPRFSRRELLTCCLSRYKNGECIILHQYRLGIGKSSGKTSFRLASPQCFWDAINPLSCLPIVTMLVAISPAIIPLDQLPIDYLYNVHLFVIRSYLVFSCYHRVLHID